MNFEALNTFMDSLLTRGYPFAEIAVAKEGKVVFRKSVAIPEITESIPKKELYWIFSASKVITCIAAMRLVERGLLSLADPVSKYIPEFASVTVAQPEGEPLPAKTVMTVEHLFTMSAGLTYDINTPALREARTEEATTLDVVRAMAKTPLMFEPGARYAYSLCHDVLAAIVELVSGMKFAEYLKENIFSPLGITDMGFFPTEEQLSRFFPMYTYQNGLQTVLPKKLYNGYRLTPQFESGGAGLFASIDEYIKIIAVVANGGKTEDGYVLLRPETIAMMQENRLCDAARNDFAGSRFYGYGWGLCGRVHMDPHISFSKSPKGEFGWDGAANAYVLIDPENKLAIYFGTQILGCNYGYQMIHPRLRDLTYGAWE